MRRGVAMSVLALVACGSPAPAPPPTAAAPAPPPELPPPDLASIEAEGFVRAEELTGSLTTESPRAEHAVGPGDGCAIAARLGTGPALTLGWSFDAPDLAISCADSEPATSPAPLSVSGPLGTYRIAILRAPRDEAIVRSLWAGGTASMVQTALGLRADGLVPLGPWRRVQVEALDVDRTELPADAPCWTIVLDDPTPVVAAPVPIRFRARVTDGDGSAVWTTGGGWLDACASGPPPFTLEIWGTSASILARAFRAGAPEAWSDGALDRALRNRGADCAANWLVASSCLVGVPDCEPDRAVDRAAAISVLRARDCAAVDEALGRAPPETPRVPSSPPVRRAGAIHTTIGPDEARPSRRVRTWFDETLSPALLACYERELAYHADAAAEATFRVVFMLDRTLAGPRAGVPSWLHDCRIPSEPVAGQDWVGDVEVGFAPAE